MTKYVIGPDVAIRLARDEAVIRGEHQILAPEAARADQRARFTGRLSNQSAQDSIVPIRSNPAEGQGSRPRRALMSFSSAASTACRVCSPSPTGPPRMMKPSSMSPSMNAACSTQPCWSRIWRGSQPGP